MQTSGERITATDRGELRKIALFSRNSSCTGVTDFPAVNCRSDGFHLREVWSGPSVANHCRVWPPRSYIAPCFSARDREEFAKSVAELWPAARVGVCGQRCAPREGRRGNGVIEGIATSPRPRYCFTSSTLFSYSLVSLVSISFFESSSETRQR